MDSEGIAPQILKLSSLMEVSCSLHHRPLFPG